MARCVPGHVARAFFGVTAQRDKMETDAFLRICPDSRGASLPANVAEPVNPR